MKTNVKIIFHVDMNAFFASVEEIKYPFLKDKPFAVGTRSSKRGVLSTANYVARKYGVGSAMSQAEALKKCPSLIIVDCHFDLYQEYSMMFMNILKEYTNIYMQASVDEAYLDMTKYLEDKDAIKVAKEIQNRLLHELGLPCSIGIGPNLFLAKMGSDYKKPLGITVFRYRDVPEKLWPLPIGDMYGIGKKTVPRLNTLGIYKIGDLANFQDKDKLREVMGEKYYLDVINKANGRGTNIIDMNPYVANQSIGTSRTFDEDSDDEDVLKGHLKRITNLVCDRLNKHNYYGKTVSIIIKYFDFTSITRSKTISKYIYLFDDVYEIASDLFDKNWDGRRVRLLGVTVSNVIERTNIHKDYDLFDLDIIEKEQKLIDVKKNLENKFGAGIIKKTK